MDWTNVYIEANLKSTRYALATLNGRKVGMAVVGVILLLLGIVFALQGANVIGGSALMSGNSTYIYVGGVVAVVGLIILALGFRAGGKTMSSKPEAPQVTQ